MTAKPKVAVYWLGACGGCDETIVDLNEVLLDISQMVEIVLWPIALDFKYSSIEKMADGGISLTVISGAVRNSEHLEMAELLRRKSETVLALGACACFGGTPGLANFRSKDDIFQWVYRDAPTVVNPEGVFPQAETEVDGRRLTLPKFFDHVYTLDQIIRVDYYLPGCPPPAEAVGASIKAVLSGDLPPKGSVLAPRKALCDTCPRNKKKPQRIEIRQIKRVHMVEADSDACFLAGGIICLGPATRSGCGETCIRINMPCRGCFGPVPSVVGQGPRYLSTLTSLIKAEKDEDIQEIIDSIEDPAGFFYRFSEPLSILGRKRIAKNGEEEHD